MELNPSSGHNSDSGENEWLMDLRSTPLGEFDDSPDDGSSEDGTTSPHDSQNGTTSKDDSQNTNNQNTKVIPPDDSPDDSSSKEEAHVGPLRRNTWQKKPAPDCTFYDQKIKGSVVKNCLEDVNEWEWLVSGGKENNSFLTTKYMTWSSCIFKVKFQKTKIICLHF